jgi:hypothetical protein
MNPPSSVKEKTDSGSGKAPLNGFKIEAAVV